MPKCHAPGPPVESRLRERATTAASALLRSVRARSDDRLESRRRRTAALRAAYVGFGKPGAAKALPAPFASVVGQSPAPHGAFGRTTHRHAEGLRAVTRPDRKNAFVRAILRRDRGRLAARKTQRIETLRARLIINCMGPRSDLSAASDPLVVQLFRSGQITADPLGLGLVVDQHSRVQGTKGHCSRWGQ